MLVVLMMRLSTVVTSSPVPWVDVFPLAVYCIALSRQNLPPMRSLLFALHEPLTMQVETTSQKLCVRTSLFLSSSFLL